MENLFCAEALGSCQAVNAAAMLVLLVQYYNHEMRWLLIKGTIHTASVRHCFSKRTSVLHRENQTYDWNWTAFIYSTYEVEAFSLYACWFQLNIFYSSELCHSSRTITYKSCHEVIFFFLDSLLQDKSVNTWIDFLTASTNLMHELLGWILTKVII